MTMRLAMMSVLGWCPVVCAQGLKPSPGTPQPLPLYPYVVRDLGSFGGGIAATDIAEDGTVVGWGVVRRFDYQMFVFDGALSPLAPLAPRTQAQATAAGDGAVLGAGYSMGDVVPEALIASAGLVEPAGPFVPTGAGSDGRVVGIRPMLTGDGFVVESACELEAGVLSVLPTLPGGHDTAAFDTSDEGWIVGSAFGPDALVPTPVLWIDGSPIQLGTLGGQGGQARAINSRRQVVGWARDAADEPHAFLFELGPGGEVLTRTDLGTLDAKASHARDINCKGVVVGTSGSHAFVYRDGQMIDLNSRIDPASGWTLVDATGINDAGQIVGYGHREGQPLAAFVLTPSIRSADLNCDTEANATDLRLFIERFAAGAPMGDWNGDGDHDSNDLLAFLASCTWR